MNDSNDFMEFFLKHKGSIIGGLIAIIVVGIGLHKLILALIVIGFGIWLGNYIQKNKEKVKENLKRFIDRF